MDMIAEMVLYLNTFIYAHVYHKDVGKKGANNEVSLIVKTLQQLNLLPEEAPILPNFRFLPACCSGRCHLSRHLTWSFDR